MAQPSVGITSGILPKREASMTVNAMISVRCYVLIGKMSFSGKKSPSNEEVVNL
jgi:hypothetical protein